MTPPSHRPPNKPKPGAADETARLVREVEEAAAKDSVASISGTVSVTTLLSLSSQSVRMAGDGPTTIQVSGRSTGCAIGPSGEPAGPISPAPVGAERITVPKATWSTDELVGAWVEMFDPSGSPTRMSRRITANSTDELTLEHPLGRPIGKDCTATIFIPLDSVELTDLDIARIQPGGTNLLVQYCRSVRLVRVSSADGGQEGAKRGNGISILHCDSVEVSGTSTSNSSNFGLFIYNCDSVVVEDYIADGWGGQFGVQLKDCRTGVIRRATCTAKGDNGDQGDSGISLKCSGLNPAVDLRAEDCIVRRTRLAAFEFSSITNEGTYFSGQSFTFERCRAEKPSTHGFSCVLDGKSSPTQWSWLNCTSATAGGVGFIRPTAGHQIIGCTARRSGADGMSISAPNVRVAGGALLDNGRSFTRRLGGGSSEIVVTGDDAIIEHVRFVRTKAGGTSHAVRSMGANRTLVKGCTVEDTTNAFATAYALEGSGSRVES